MNDLVTVLEKMLAEAKDNCGQKEDGKAQAAVAEPSILTRQNLSEFRGQTCLLAGSVIAETEKKEPTIDAGEAIWAELKENVREKLNAAGSKPNEGMNWQQVRIEFASMLESVLSAVYEKIEEVDPAFVGRFN